MNKNLKIIGSALIVSTLIIAFAVISSPKVKAAVKGCTDSNASNYDPEAGYDDESCIYPYSGELPQPATTAPTPAPTPTPRPTVAPLPPNAGGSAPGPSLPANSGGGSSGGGAAGLPSNAGGGSSGSRTSTGLFYIQNPTQFNSVGDLVNGFLEIFSYIVVLLGVLMLMWVGLQFVLAQGNVEKMKELKNWLLWIVVGIAIVIGARIIVRVVINTLQASGANSQVIQSANSALQRNP